MKLQKTALLLLSLLVLGSCASGYKPINPETINYISNNKKDGILLEYKYGLLSNKKYAKKETKKAVKLIAIKVTNATEKDLVFGKDIKLSYEDGKEVYVLESDKIFKAIKQHPASYLFYMLLSFVTFQTSSANSTSTTPIGLVLGPGITAANMITAGSANKKLKTELLTYDINGTVVKKGATIYGLIGINSSNYDALKIGLR